MQIFKHFLLVGSIAFALSPVCLRADDTEAQAMARAALQQKMREMGGQAPDTMTPPANTPPASQIKTTTPPKSPAPPVQKQTPRTVQVPAPRRSSPGQPPIAPPAARPAPMDSAIAPGTAQASPTAAMVAPGASSPDLIEQARQATRAKMAELQSQQNNSAPQPAVQPATTTVPATTKTTPPVVTAGKPAQPSKAEIKAAKEREAAAAKAAAQQAKLAADQEKKAPAEAVMPAAKVKPGAPAPFTPLAGPASSLPALKEQRLQTLLDQYKADKITAEEYHDQRAKIIAEP